MKKMLQSDNKIESSTLKPNGVYMVAFLTDLSLKKSIFYKEIESFFLNILLYIKVIEYFQKQEFNMLIIIKVEL